MSLLFYCPRLTCSELGTYLAVLLVRSVWMSEVGMSMFSAFVPLNFHVTLTLVGFASSSQTTRTASPLAALYESRCPGRQTGATVDPVGDQKVAANVPVS